MWCMRWDGCGANALQSEDAANALQSEDAAKTGRADQDAAAFHSQATLRPGGRWSSPRCGCPPPVSPSAGAGDLSQAVMVAATGVAGAGKREVGKTGTGSMAVTGKSERGNVVVTGKGCEILSGLRVSGMAVIGAEGGTEIGTSGQQKTEGGGTGIGTGMGTRGGGAAILAVEVWVGV
eukprot:1141678-Pelagomonas_calceolata.AAC.7